MEIAMFIVSSLVVPGLIYYYQNKSQKKIDEYTSKSLNLIRKQSEISKDLLINIRNDELRTFMNLFSEEEKSYWHYKWRFETFDELGLTIQLEDDYLSNITVKVLGTTKKFNDRSIGHNYEFYICKLIESDQKVYKEGDFVSCFFFNDKKYISKNIDTSFIPEDRFTFSILSLGTPAVGISSEKPASEINFHPRLKDI